MRELTLQQLCAEMGISESTVRRLELDGLPYTPIGIRGNRYNLSECKAWLREHQCQSGKKTASGTVNRWTCIYDDDRMTQGETFREAAMAAIRDRQERAAKVVPLRLVPTEAST